MLVLLFLALLQIARFQSPTPTPTPAAPTSPYPAAVSFNKGTLLNKINGDRAYWGIPLVDYDDELAQIAQQTCMKCVWADLGSSDERGPKLGFLKGFEYNGARYQSTAQTNAAGVGNADPIRDLPWLHRQDWGCESDSCNASTGCLDYTQLVWYDTTGVGCGRCVCDPESSPIPGDSPWQFLVCLWNMAGNYNGGHPFGDAKAAICAGPTSGGYTIPPPEPQPVCQTCDNGCETSIEGATCTDGVWTIDGPIDIADFKEDVWINCPVLINGDLTGDGSRRLNLTNCGTLNVTGTVTLTGTVAVGLDFQSLSPLITAPDTDRFQNFINYGSITGSFGTPVARNVFSPTVKLCNLVVTGSTGSYLYLYDCSVGNPTVPTPLPDGGTVQSQSPSASTYSPPVPGSGGSISDPDLNTAPKGSNLDDFSPPSDGDGLPGWAIFLIVLGCVLFVVILIVIIVLLVSSNDDSERF